VQAGKTHEVAITAGMRGRSGPLPGVPAGSRGRWPQLCMRRDL